VMFFWSRAKGNSYLISYDNAGEVGFDSLLIATLREMDATVNLVVKKDPFFEDATIQDASPFLSIISGLIFSPVNGFFIPEIAPPSSLTSLKQVTLSSQKAQELRGPQGKLRGKRVIYLLKVKCNPISTGYRAPVGPRR